MGHYEDLYPARFLKGVTLLEPKIVRIVSMNTDVLEGDKGKEKKAILRYRDDKGDGEMVCCKTNAALIAAMLGPITEDWAGKLITLHFDKTVSLGAEQVGGVRVCGSPGLKQPLKVEIKRPRRKKPEVYVLSPTAVQKKATDAPPTAPAPETSP